MSDRSSYEPGEFCWVDLTVPDTEAAAAFYKELLGWDWEAGGAETFGYGVFTAGDDKRLAGMGQTQSEEQPPAWASYVSVADADETAGKVKDAGGSVVVEPFDVVDIGRMAGLSDPQGAFFGVWQPKSHIGAQRVNEIGCWTWSNLLTRDLEGMKRFYREVFGWETAKNEEAPEGILNWHLEGQRWPEGLGGLMQITDELPAEMPSLWEVYFLVEDLDKGMDTIKSAGGQLTAGPIEIPVGRIAAGTDPQGAHLALMEPDYPEPR